MAYRRYQRALKNAGAVDFDDLLLCTEELFDQFPDVLTAEAGLFDHLLVDEYQDTNGSQYRIVRALAARHRNLCVVGDDDQSIYGWRGAEVEHILRFAKDWPDATVVRLEDNYRSTTEIIEHANRLIVFNKTRHDKVLRAARPGGEKPRILQCKDETEEAKAVVDEIRRQLRKPGVEPGDIAILFRTNEQPRAFEAEMRRATGPLRADRRHVVLRPQRGPRHAGLPQVAGHAPRRNVAAADHQYAATRDRLANHRNADGHCRGREPARLGRHGTLPRSRCPPLPRPPSRNLSPCCKPIAGT